MQCLKSTLKVNCQICSMKEPSLLREWVSPEGVVFPSLSMVKANSFPGHDIMPIETFDTDSLCDEREVMDPMWESLTLKFRVFDNGHPEIWFWSYVDIDVKDDPSVWC